MSWRACILVLSGLICTAPAALAADCPGNPSALGTSRVLAIDPHEFPRIGTVQYSRSLPLADREVVLTFDDGPMPPYTNRVLEVLAEQCVRANYFILGRMARGYPDLLKKVAAQGHVIGNHSQNHPLAFERMPLSAVQAEVEQGFASLLSVLGDRRLMAPFFRIPGLLRAKEVEGYLQSRRLVTWSADVVADDWKHISASEVVRRAMARLDEKGKGILLLHDIQPATALAMPELLRELKAKGYRIVQVAPRGAAPAPAPAPVAAQPPPVQEALAKSPVPVAPAAAPAQEEAEPVAEETAAPITTSSVPQEAAQSLARGEPVPQEPARPFATGIKPSRNMPTPGKLLSSEPGGWPPAVNIAVPKAGGVGVSPVARDAGTVRDGRFR